MGVYIPNMEKPKKGEVIAFDGEYAVYTDDNMQVHRYSLIEIVRCGECKHFNLNEWDETICGVPIIVAHEICHKWGDDGHQTSKDGFCFMGERRADEE